MNRKEWSIEEDKVARILPPLRDDVLKRYYCDLKARPRISSSWQTAYQPPWYRQVLVIASLKYRSLELRIRLCHSQVLTSLQHLHNIPNSNHRPDRFLGGHHLHPQASSIAPSINPPILLQPILWFILHEDKNTSVGIIGGKLTSRCTA